MPTKNIIFDLGVVILDVDYNLTAAAFKKLGLVDFDAHYSKIKQDNFFDRFETGHMPDAEFRDIIRKHLPHTVTDQQIDDAWNAMLLTVPETTFELLENIGKQKRIFLLSNTNRIHIAAFTKIIEKQYGFSKFESLFEKTYYSCNIGMRKPNAEIFEYVVKKNNLSITETLFIDDSPQHVEGARKYGLTALHLHTETNLQELVNPR
jgi:glucose-1-phosphatase